MVPPPPPPPPLPANPPPGGTSVMVENGDIYPVSAPNNKSLVILNVINTITHIILGVVGFSAIIFANALNPSFLKQHIYLCVIGYIILMSSSVLSLSPHTNWTKGLDYGQKKLIHLILQVIGASIALAGSIIVIINIDNNFQTPHGILGLIATIFTILSLVGGVINLLSSKKLNIKILHSCLGSLTLIFAFISLCFAFHDLYRLIMGDTNANLSIALSVFALIGTLVSVFVNTFKRLGF